MNLTQIFLDISINDLKSAMLLYEKRFYRNSYFLFQQSAEKANKALGMFLGHSSFEELKKVSHNPMRIYRKIIKKQADDINEFNLRIKQHNNIVEHEFTKRMEIVNYNASLDAGLKGIDDLGKMDLINIPVAELRYLSDTLGELLIFSNKKNKLPRGFEKDIEPEFEKVIYEFADWIGKFGIEGKKKKSEFEELIQKNEFSKELIPLLPKLFDIYFDLIFIFYSFSICAVITLQHCSLTRYPDNGKNPLKIYTNQLPLIKMQSCFMKILGEALIKFRKLAKSQN